LLLGRLQASRKAFPVARRRLGCARSQAKQAHHLLVLLREGHVRAAFIQPALEVHGCPGVHHTNAVFC
jgi:hypothetical protein